MRGLGLLRALVVVAASAGLVVGAGHVRGSLDVSPASASTLATGSSTDARGRRAVPVTSSAVVCPGPEAAGVQGLKESAVTGIGLLVATPPAGLVPRPSGTSRAPDQVRLSGLPAGGSWPTLTGRTRLASAGDQAARSVLVTGTGSLAPGVVATQRSRPQGSQRALVSAACRPPVAESWLVGGGGQPGRRERVVLSNPGATSVSVDLSVVGSKGPIVSPNGRGVVVGPHSRTVVLLDAISGSEPAPVVRVTAYGGDVAAVLQDSWLDGVVPRGADDALPSAAPSRDQVLPGVTVAGTATLRVAVPGDQEAVVQTRVLTPSGPRTVPRDAVVRVPAHSSHDIDLTGLRTGSYAVQVRADVPVVAGAMVQRRAGSGGPSDLAWTTAAPPLTALAGMPLRSPSDSSLTSTLSLAATHGTGSVRVTQVAADGSVRSSEVQVVEDGVGALDLGRSVALWLSVRSGTVRAAVVTTGVDTQGTLVSVTPLDDLVLTTLPVTVHPLPQ